MERKNPLSPDMTVSGNFQFLTFPEDPPWVQFQGSALLPGLHKLGGGECWIQKQCKGDKSRIIFGGDSIKTHTKFWILIFILILILICKLDLTLGHKEKKKYWQYCTPASLGQLLKCPSPNWLGWGTTLRPSKYTKIPSDVRYIINKIKSRYKRCEER